MSKVITALEKTHLIDALSVKMMGVIDGSEREVLLVNESYMVVRYVAVVRYVVRGDVIGAQLDLRSIMTFDADKDTPTLHPVVRQALAKEQDVWLSVMRNRVLREAARLVGEFSPKALFTWKPTPEVFRSGGSYVKIVAEATGPVLVWDQVRQLVGE